MLDSIERALSNEGVAARRIAANDAAPLEQLNVALAADERNRARELWITPLLGLDEQLAEGVGLCQFFVELPFHLQAAAYSDLAALLFYLNNIIPLGAFGLRHPEGSIWYRNVLVLGPNAASNGAVAVETVLLISYLVDQLSTVIEAVATGHQTLAQAVAELGNGTRTA